MFGVGTKLPSESMGFIGMIDQVKVKAAIWKMKHWVLTCLGLLFLVPAGLAQDARTNTQEAAFQGAISAAEKRDYVQLRLIVEENPSVLDHRTETGDDLFHEFLYVFHEESEANLGTAIDLTAIETLLDIGAVPTVSNGLLATLLLAANDFGGEIDTYPINSGQCTENRESFFLLSTDWSRLVPNLGRWKSSF